MKVPFIDFSEQYQVIKEEIDVGLRAVFEKGNFILGEEEKDFENDFARYCEAEYAIGVNSGTDALYLALAAVDAGPGDEVILPSFTFIATALCISYTGATPVFIDVEDRTCNLDPAKLEGLITGKTKAIIPVHLYGQSANMNEINAIAKKHNITVIEDACQAHGATYNKKKIGSVGNIACFSFYPTKSLGGFGDGGMIVTNDKGIYEKCVMLRDYGRLGRYEHKIKGYNSRLDTVQAVVLSAKLKHLDQWNQMRVKAAQKYYSKLEGVKGIKFIRCQEDRTHVFQTFAVRVKNRDQICQKMQEKGIGVLIHYPIPVHLQEAYSDAGYKKGDLPLSEQMADEVLSLPMFPHITDEQIDYVCSTLKSVIQDSLDGAAK